MKLHYNAGKNWMSCLPGRKSVLLLAVIVTLLSTGGYSQVLHNIVIGYKQGLTADSAVLADNSTITFSGNRPVYSFLLNDKLFNSVEVSATKTGDQFLQIFENNLKVSLQLGYLSVSGFSGEINFENIGKDTVSIGNVVPFGEDNNSVIITGKGSPDLARAWLSRPGYKPLRVILPDNAWELGYSSFLAGKELSVCAITRRLKIEEGVKQRYKTVLPPKAKVIYSFYADVFRGEWQNGLRMMFRDKYLHDLNNFDNSLYGRKDLLWIKESYLIILQMAWDMEFYDRFSGKYTYPEDVRSWTDQFGKIDVFGIWPTWPRLGLDQRNQWDLYRDLPGGTEQLKRFARSLRQSDSRFFIAYNPWDNSTRKEDHLKGMAQMIAETEADGVVLDTRGNSGPELQAAADSIRKGVIMYSEGMAIPKDMPGIISGRVHNAIYMSPELNLNKLIKPDFSIFRVCDVGEDILHREIAVSFFNGYGTELNMFRPGRRDENYRKDLDFLAHTTFILRQNNDAFLDNGWTPLVETTIDSVYVNQWKSGDKTIYTILNMRAAGINQKLFKVENKEARHFVSLWNHENLSPVIDNGTSFISSKADGWQSLYSGTRREGSVDCIAQLPDLIKSRLVGDSIKIKKIEKGILLIWKGDPSYQTLHKDFRILSDTTIGVKNLFGFYEGKIVLQLIENKILADENVLTLRGGKPWIISRNEVTKRSLEIPPEMVLVPGTQFSFNVTANDEFIPYPDVSGRTVTIDSFLIDKYPVTNAEYYEFLSKTKYRPADTSRFLRHWQSGTFKQGQENYPVVYVSYEDIVAYTKWAGKRLPSEAEWQLAAQGQDKRRWPWGDEFHGTYCNNSFDRPTPVDAFSKGQSPYGAIDMVGNVWQMTGDIYFNGINYFTVIRGGSWFNPESSSWYIHGGPQSLDKTQILLMVSPGFDRSETVGFRCVKDIDSKNFKYKVQK
jgi:gamma-glutamyl hercynylcysteine S-oxide synthase